MSKLRSPETQHKFATTQNIKRWLRGELFQLVNQDHEAELTPTNLGWLTFFTNQLCLKIKDQIEDDGSWRRPKSQLELNEGESTDGQD